MRGLSHGGGPFLRFDPCTKSLMGSIILHSVNLRVFLHHSIFETYSDVLHIVKEERNILLTIKRRKANLIGHIWRGIDF
jgi:hypothetical protein